MSVGYRLSQLLTVPLSQGKPARSQSGNSFS